MIYMVYLLVTQYIPKIHSNREESGRPSPLTAESGRSSAVVI